MPKSIISRFMDTTGDGTGTYTGVGDFSSTARTLRILAAPNERLSIARLIVGVEGDSFANSDLYGSGLALTNGILLWVADSEGTVKYNLIDPRNPVTKNGEWAHYCYDFQRFSTAFPQGNDLGAVRWTFAKSGVPVILNPGWSLNLLLQDDLTTGTTGLVEHHFLVQGYEMTYREPSDVGHA
jgi:hypothetical protein